MQCESFHHTAPSQTSPTSTLCTQTAGGGGQATGTRAGNLRGSRGDESTPHTPRHRLTTRSAAARMHETHLRCTTEVASCTSDALTAQGTSPWSSRQGCLHPTQRRWCTSTRRRHCSATSHHRAQRDHQRCDRTSSKVLSLTWRSQDSLRWRNRRCEDGAETGSNRPAIPL
jgi:hypothetical protein